MLQLSLSNGTQSIIIDCAALNLEVNDGDLQIALQNIAVEPKNILFNVDKIVSLNLSENISLNNLYLHNYLINCEDNTTIKYTLVYRQK